MGVPEVVQLAQWFVGVRERGGENKGPEVEMFQQAIGKAEGESWCMSFVQWVTKRVSARIFRNPVMASSEGCLEVWRNTPSIYRSAVPLPGTVVIWQHGNTEKGHTGFVKLVTDDPAEFITIEGNTRVDGDLDGVYERRRKMSGDGDMKILGFIKPFG